MGNSICLSSISIVTRIPPLLIIFHQIGEIERSIDDRGTIAARHE